MKLSIIITSYNYGRYLKMAIDSALTLPWQDKEVIVVDDESTDDSPQIIESYGSRITAIFQTNGGEVKASNTGFAVSTGDIIIFCDSDDFLFPSLASALRAVWHEGISKVQYPLRHVDAVAQPTGRVWPIYNAASTPAEMRRMQKRTGIYPAPPTTGNAWGRSFLAKIFPVQTGKRPGITRYGKSPFAYGDYMIYLDSYLNGLAPFFGDVISLTEPHAAYRNHDSNIGYKSWSLDEMIWMCQMEADRAILSNVVLRTNNINGEINIERYYRHMLHRLIYKRLVPNDYAFTDRMPTIYGKFCMAVANADRDCASKMMLWAGGLAMLMAPRRALDAAVKWKRVR